MKNKMNKIHAVEKEKAVCSVCKKEFVIPKVSVLSSGAIWVNTTNPGDPDIICEEPSCASINKLKRKIAALEYELSFTTEATRLNKEDMKSLDKRYRRLFFVYPVLYTLFYVSAYVLVSYLFN